VLAAGEGTRLRPYSADRPKCLVELGGQSLLAHQLGVLSGAGIADITVVTGYRSEQIEALGLPTFHNPLYAKTNMVASLMYARELLDGSDDVLVAYADIVYEPAVVAAIAGSPAPFATTVDLDWYRLWSERLSDPLADAETLRLDADGHILELGRKPRSLADIEGQYMGLIRFSAAFAPTAVAFYEALDPCAMYDGKDLPNMYMTSFLQALVDAGHPLQAIPVHGGWLEVDSRDDLEGYRQMLAEGRLETFWSPRGNRPRGRAD
jgi:choline kinase